MALFTGLNRCFFSQILASDSVLGLGALLIIGSVVSVVSV